MGCVSLSGVMKVPGAVSAVDVEADLRISGKKTMLCIVDTPRAEGELQRGARGC